MISDGSTSYLELIKIPSETSDNAGVTSDLLCEKPGPTAVLSGRKTSEGVKLAPNFGGMISF